MQKCFNALWNHCLWFPFNLEILSDLISNFIYHAKLFCLTIKLVIDLILITKPYTSEALGTWKEDVYKISPAGLGV